MTRLSDVLNRMTLGNCIDVMAEMPAACVDMVLTDPPYMARYRDRSGRSVAGDDTDAWLLPAFTQMYRLLRDDTFCVSFYGWHKADTFLSGWRAAGFVPRAHLVWPKRYASHEGAVRYCHEAAYVLSKGNPPPFEVISDVLEWGYTGNVYHPTQKPLVALRPVVRAFSREGGVVLDPFAGSGSTAVAAQELGRQFIAIEMDDAYCHTARRRLAAWHRTSPPRL